MPYTAEISRGNPTCFLFLIDQSGSMSDPSPFSPGKSKANALADAINNLLRNLSLQCSKEEGVRNYYYIGVIGYGGNGVKFAFEGVLANQPLVPISEIADHPYRIEEKIKDIEDGAGDIIQKKVKFPIWFEASASGGTPMCEAFKKAHSILTDWVHQYPNSFPPIVIHLTDGESTDGDPSLSAQHLQELATNDGNVLIFNAHISSKPLAPMLFSDNENLLPDQHAKLLFKISSLLPSHMREVAEGLGFQVSEKSKAFVFNADLVDVIKFLKVGTQPSNLR